MGRDDEDLTSSDDNRTLPPADRLDDEDARTVGLPPGIDLAQLPFEDLAEAELVAISEGEPELAAILADELARRRRRS